MTQINKEAVAAARSRLSPRRQREAKYFCLSYHDTPRHAMLQGLQRILEEIRLDNHKGVEKDHPTVLSDFAVVVDDEWERLSRRGHSGFYAYAKGYSVGRYGEGMAMNPHHIQGSMWDHWNDGWKSGREEFENAPKGED